MKKNIFMILISIVFIMFLGGCSNTYNEYVQISYNELENAIENKETFPLVIGSSTCSACEMYKPTMEHFIQKNDIKIYFIDTQELTEEESIKLRGMVSFDSTPTTVFYENGKLLHSSKWIVGAADIKKVTEVFKNNGYNVK